LLDVDSKGKRPSNKEAGLHAQGGLNAPYTTRYMLAEILAIGYVKIQNAYDQKKTAK
jgi:hypothetical protein